MNTTTVSSVLNTTTTAAAIANTTTIAATIYQTDPIAGVIAAGIIFVVIIVICCIYAHCGDRELRLRAWGREDWGRPCIGSFGWCQWKCCTWWEKHRNKALVKSTWWERRRNKDLYNI